MTRSSTVTPHFLCGILSKKSPSRWSIRSNKERFVMLQDGVLYWSSSASSGPVSSAGPPDCRGWVSFFQNPFCEVAEDTDSMTKFMLKPANGRWSRGEFTGAESGRIFLFDTLTDSRSRADWVTALRAHIAFGDELFLRSMRRPAAQVNPTLVIPKLLGEVTDEFLTQALRKAGVLEETTYVESFKMQRTSVKGEGHLSETGFINLCYGPIGEPKDAPRGCVLKIPNKMTVLKAFGAEVFFYQTLARDISKTGVLLPKVFVAVAPEEKRTPSTKGYAILMENLTHPQRQPCLQGVSLIDGVPLEYAMPAVRDMARWHSTFWGLSHEAVRGMEVSPGVPKFHPEYIAHIEDVGTKSFLGCMMKRSVESLVELLGPKSLSLISDNPEFDGFRSLGVYACKLWPVLQRHIGTFLQRVLACPTALVHGDCHCENMFINTESEPAVTWVDFQDVHFGPAVEDLSYFLSTSMRVEDRQNNELALLRCYHDSLLANNVKNYSFEQCYADYKFMLFVGLYHVGNAMTDDLGSNISTAEGLFSDSPTEQARRGRIKCNSVMQRVAAAMEAASWDAFLRDGPEDSEEQHPLDPARPINFG